MSSSFKYDEKDKILKNAIEERLAHWRALSPSEQIESLDRRLGKGVGAVKQRAKIAALMSPKKNVQKESVPEVAQKKKAKERRANEQAERPSK